MKVSMRKEDKQLGITGTNIAQFYTTSNTIQYKGVKSQQTISDLRK